MANEQRSIVWTLPPIGPWSKRLATAAGALWVAHLVLYFVARPSHVEALPTVKYLSLIPAKALGSGQLWRVLSYAMLDLPNSFDGLWSALFLWWFGTPIEQREGPRGIVIPWLVGALGGAAALIAVSRVSLDYHVSAAMGLFPVLSTALVVKWGFLFARQRVSLLGLAEMDGRVLAGILCAIPALNALSRLRERDANSVIALAALIATGVFLFAQSRTGTGDGPAKRKRIGSGSFTVIKGGKSGEKEPKKWVN
jgi:membrane associated rhomboid family serine protease